MATPAVIGAIRTEAGGRGATKTKQVRGKCERLLNEIHSTMEDQPPRQFGWMLRKVWRQVFDKILIHEAGMERVRALAERLGSGASLSVDSPRAAQNRNLEGNKARPIVLLPSHRSYADFLLLSYIFFAYNVPVPHIAAADDFASLGK